MGSRIRGKIFHFQPAKIISPTLTEEIVLTNWLWLAHRVHWSAQHWTLWEFVLICQRTNWTRVENQTSLGLFCCRCCRVWSGRVSDQGRTLLDPGWLPTQVFSCWPPTDCLGHGPQDRNTRNIGLSTFSWMWKDWTHWVGFEMITLTPLALTVCFLWYKMLERLVQITKDRSVVEWIWGCVEGSWENELES